MRRLQSDENDNKSSRNLTHEERLQLIYAPISIGTVLSAYRYGRGRSVQWEGDTNYSQRSITSTGLNT